MTPRRPRTNYLVGLSAEDQVARAYQKRGAEILARRHRNEAGEIDLILRLDGILVFVEVKRRKNRAALSESITDRQWRRLGMAATHYMMSRKDETGPVSGCRFDAALVGADGSFEIIENARSFDEH
ncbi:MAG TPA: YraN family protein [Thermohalobaculum sp.]|nr:YraN family protein [Thermohalobaculum sp.]